MFNIENHAVAILQAALKLLLGLGNYAFITLLLYKNAK
jgi:hypothetical protein